MSEHEDTKRTHGFGDHHHVAPKKMRLDPNYQAPKEVKDLVWDMLQGKAPVQRDEPGVVIVPEEYVHTVATCAIRELRAQGAAKGFSVAVDPEQPVVKIAFTRQEDLARMTQMRSGYEMTTDCLTAYVNELDPVGVGKSAATAFLHALQKALREGN